MLVARPRVLALAAAASIAAGGAARAAETPGTNFPLGVNTAAAAQFPPPGGTVLFNFNALYSASKYNAARGNPRPPGFGATVFAEAVRLNHTWVNLAPGITLGSGFAANLVHQTVRVGGERWRGGVQFASPDLIPYNLDFQVSPTLWVSHALNVFPALGQYSKRDRVNAGLGYATVAPEVAATWLPSPRWEVSADAWTGFNLRNRKTGYQSGNEFNLDYLVGYRPLDSLPALQVGVNGYAYTQWTDDSLRGARVGDGNRGRVFAIGPQIRYDIGHGGVIAKWQHEVGARNRPSGDRFWFQFALPL